MPEPVFIENLNKMAVRSVIFLPDGIGGYNVYLYFAPEQGIDPEVMFTLSDVQDRPTLADGERALKRIVYYKRYHPSLVEQAKDIVYEEMKARIEIWGAVSGIKTLIIYLFDETLSKEIRRDAARCIEGYLDGPIGELISLKIKEMQIGHRGIPEESIRFFFENIGNDFPKTKALVMDFMGLTDPQQPA